MRKFLLPAPRLETGDRAKLKMRIVVNEANMRYPGARIAYILGTPVAQMTDSSLSYWAKRDGPE